MVFVDKSDDTDEMFFDVEKQAAQKWHGRIW